MNKLVRQCLLIATLFALLGSAFGSEWYFAARSKDGVFSVDKQSIVITGDYRKAWVSETLFKAKNLPTTPPKPYLSTNSSFVFDCRNRSATRLQITYYSKILRDGEILETVVTRAEDVTKFSEIPPDSTGEQLLQFVCADSNAK